MSRSGVLGQRWQKIDIFGEEIGKFSKNKLGKEFYQVSIIKMHILDKFHEEIKTFDKISDIYCFYRAQTRASESPLRKKGGKF